ncbi:hypothetical protein LTR62_002892 [Meristemomyces frigidus]|uniref:Uncharacterized protein n=1 Tax=Meristemomyces frigidus TaxID=1508187 RepID=A0AAN7TRQ7_9PEZI|nr:hypothetical protein LTR62_002892 [Meristemomyces frigidus]
MADDHGSPISRPMSAWSNASFTTDRPDSASGPHSIGRDIDRIKHLVQRIQARPRRVSGNTFTAQVFRTPGSIPEENVTNARILQELEGLKRRIREEQQLSRRRPSDADPDSEEDVESERAPVVPDERDEELEDVRRELQIVRQQREEWLEGAESRIDKLLEEKDSLADLLEETRTESRALRKDHETASVDIAAAKKQVTELEGRVAEVQQSLELARSEVEQLRTSHTEAVRIAEKERTAKEELFKQLDDVQESLEEVRKQVEQLNSEKREQDIAHHDMQEALKSAEAAEAHAARQLTEVRSALHETQEEVAQLKKQHELTVNELADQKAASETVQYELEARLVHSDSRIAELEEKNSQAADLLRQARDDHESNERALKLQYNKATNEAEHAKGKCADLEETLATRDSRINELEEKNSHEAELLRQTIADHESLREASKTQYRKLQDKYASTVSEVQAMKARADDLAGALIEAETTTANMRTSHESQRQDLLAELDEQKKKFEQALQEVEHHESELKTLLSSRDGEKTRSERIEKDLNEARAFMCELETRCHETEAKYEFTAIQHAETTRKKAEELEELRREHVELLGKLQDEYETSETRHRGELEAVRNEHELQLEDAKTAYDNAMRELEGRHAEESQSLEAKTEEVRKQHELQMEGVHCGHGNALASLRREFEMATAEYDKEIGGLREKVDAAAGAHIRELEETRSRHGKVVAGLEKRVEGVERAGVEARQVHEAEMEGVRVRHGKALSALQDDVAATRQAADEAEQRHAEQRRAIDLKHEKALSTLHRDLAAKRDAETRRNEATEKGRATHAEQLATTQKHLDESRKAANDAENRYTREIQMLESKHAKASDTYTAETKSAQETAKTAREKAQSKLADLAGRLAKEVKEGRVMRDQFQKGEQSHREVRRDLETEVERLRGAAQEMRTAMQQKIAMKDELIARADADISEAGKREATLSDKLQEMRSDEANLQGKLKEAQEASIQLEGRLSAQRELHQEQVRRLEEELADVRVAAAESATLGKRTDAELREKLSNVNGTLIETRNALAEAESGVRSQKNQLQERLRELQLQHDRAAEVAAEAVAELEGREAGLLGKITALENDLAVAEGARAEQVQRAAAETGRLSQGITELERKLAEASNAAVETKAATEQKEAGLQKELEEAKAALSKALVARSEQEALLANQQSQSHEKVDDLQKQLDRANSAKTEAATTAKQKEVEHAQTLTQLRDELFASTTRASQLSNKVHDLESAAEQSLTFTKHLVADLNSKQVQVLEEIAIARKELSTAQTRLSEQEATSVAEQTRLHECINTLESDLERARDDLLDVTTAMKLKETELTARNGEVRAIRDALAQLEKRFGAESLAQSRRICELEQECTGTVAKHEDVVRRLRERHERELEEREDGYRVELGRMEAEMRGAREEADKGQAGALEELQKSHANAIAKVESEADTKLQRLRDNHAQELERVETQYKSAGDEAERLRSTREHDLRSEHHTALENAEAVHLRALEELRASHSSALNVTKHANVAEIKSFEEKHSAALSRLASEQRQAAEKAGVLHLGELAELRRERDEVSDAASLAEQRLQEVRELHSSQLAAEKKAHESAVREFVEGKEAEFLVRVKALEQRHDEQTRARAAEHEDELGALQVELASTMAKSDTLTGKLEKLGVEHAESLRQHELGWSSRVEAMSAEHQADLRSAVAKAMSDADTKFAKRLAESEAATGSRVTALCESHVGELAEIRGVHTAELELTKQEVWGKDIELSAAHAEHEKKVDKLQERFNEQLAQLKTEHDAEKQRVLSESANEHKRLLDAHQETSRHLDSQQKAHQEELEALQSRLADVESRATSDQAQAEASNLQAMRDLVASKETEVERLRHEHQSVLERLQNTTDTKMTGVATLHRQDIEDLRSTLEKRVEESNVTHDKALKDRDMEWTNKTAALKEEQARVFAGLLQEGEISTAEKIEELRLQHDKALQDAAEHARNDARQQSEQAQKNHQAELEQSLANMRNAGAAEIQAVNNAHQVLVAQIRREVDAQPRELQDNLEAALAKSQAEWEEKTRLQAEEHSKATEQLRSTASHDIDVLRSDLEKVKALLESERMATTTERNAAKQQHEAVTVEMRQLLKDAETRATNLQHNYDNILHEFHLLETQLDAGSLGHFKAESTIVEIREQANHTRSASAAAETPLKAQLEELQAKHGTLIEEHQAANISLRNLEEQHRLVSATAADVARNEKESLKQNLVLAEEEKSQAVAVLQQKLEEKNVLAKRCEELVREVQELENVRVKQETSTKYNDAYVQTDVLASALTEGLPVPIGGDTNITNGQINRNAGLTSSLVQTSVDTYRPSGAQDRERQNRNSKAQSFEDYLQQAKVELSELGSVITANEALFAQKIQEHVGDLQRAKDQLALEYKQKFDGLSTEKERLEKDALSRGVANFTKERNQLVAKYGVEDDEVEAQTALLTSLPLKQARELRTAEEQLVSKHNRSISKQKSRIRLKHAADFQDLTQDYDREIAKLMGEKGRLEGDLGVAAGVFEREREEIDRVSVKLVEEKGGSAWGSPEVEKKAAREGVASSSYRVPPRVQSWSETAAGSERAAVAGTDADQPSSSAQGVPKKTPGTALPVTGRPFYAGGRNNATATSQPQGSRRGRPATPSSALPSSSSADRSSPVPPRTLLAVRSSAAEGRRIVSAPQRTTVEHSQTQLQPQTAQNFDLQGWSEFEDEAEIGIRHDTPLSGLRSDVRTAEPMGARRLRHTSGSVHGRRG